MKLVFDIHKKNILIIWYMFILLFINDEVLMDFYYDENQESYIVTLITDNAIGSCFR